MRLILIPFLAVIFSFDPAYAQFSETERITIDIADFSGGVNSRDGAGGIADNELQYSTNCYLTYKGIAKRNGYERYNSSARIATANAGTGIYDAAFISGQKIVATAKDSITYKGSEEWTDITGSVSITAGVPMLFTLVNNTVVAVNGTDKPWYWTGAGDADSLFGENIPTAPVACEGYKGRLFLSEGRRLYWSGYLGKWNVFHPDDNQDFNEAITGLKVIGESNQAILIVTTAHSVHACIFDPDIGLNIGGRGTFRFETITYQHGCISPYSIQECFNENGDVFLIWADIDGLKAFVGNRVLKLTDKIQPDWDDLNATALNVSRGIFYKAKWWYVFLCRDGVSSINDTVIIYDLRTLSVSGYFDWAISTAGIIRVSNVDKLIGCDYSGYWNTYDSSFNDNGVAIKSTFATKSYDSNMSTIDKAFETLMFHHKYLGEFDLTYTIYFEYTLDAYTDIYTASPIGIGLGEFRLGIDRLSGTGGLVIAGNQTRGRGRSAHIKITNNELGQPFEIYRLQMVFTPGREVLYR